MHTLYVTWRYRSPAPGARWSATAAGVLGTLLVHALLFTPLMWGGRHVRPRQPDAAGAAARHQDEKSPDSMLVVFADDSLAIHDGTSVLDPNVILPPPSLLPVARPQPPAPPSSWIDEVDDALASEADGDQTGRSMLFGRYMGQISARVERAWVRPRSIPPSGSFNCRVQITQDRRGNVEEVTLERCSEDPQWQVSLVRAIQGASPLPAPPDAAVFSNLVTLQFDSDAYVAGSSVQGFEPAPRRPTR